MSAPPDPTLLHPVAEYPWRGGGDIVVGHDV